MMDPFEVYQEAWDNRLNVIRETRPAFMPYDAHNAGLRAVAAAAWDRCLDEIEAYEINTEQAREGNPYKESE